MCRKCGWPFPNPHPSAKHRRAHKKICGTIEGYKLVGSDDEHVSDDDFKTPGMQCSTLLTVIDLVLLFSCLYIYIYKWSLELILNSKMC